jgi:RNAse (barnase) inhibitor barstar
MGETYIQFVMDPQIIVLDGNQFHDLASFYDEVERTMTKDLGWDFGRNLDAFNDLLRGGFGVYDYEEPVRLLWRRSDKSRADLGWEETVKYLQAQPATRHPANIVLVQKSLEGAQRQEGQTLFEMIVAIIQGHGHVELVLE